MFGSRLDGTVHFGTFSDKEKIEVRTKMGDVVTSGIVSSVVPNGIIVIESNGRMKFCSEKLYLFAPLQDEDVVVNPNELLDMSLDARIARKLSSMSEAGDQVPDKTGAKSMEKDGAESDKKDDDDKDTEDSKKYKDDKDGEGIVDTDSSIDVDKLPDDIKNSVITSDKLDKGKLNGILSDISDVTMKALKRAGVSELQVFDVVKRIVDSANSILTGNKK